MSFKSTSFLAAHYPNTYMEQFCKTLHPDVELGTICVSWFRQATKHCNDLLSDARTQPLYFWTTVKNFIFPDRTTDIISQKVPINIHPQRLTLHDCHSLFLDIVSDYVQRAPRYAAESTTNVMLWQVLYSLMGIMSLGSLLVGIIYAYNKYGQAKPKVNLLAEFFKPENCMKAVAKRSLRLGHAELRNIHLKPVIKTEDIVPPDGTQVLALKVKTKYDILESVVQGSLQSVGKFHRLYDQYNKTKTDFKIESINKAMKFLDNDGKKLHLMLIFEEDVDFEEELIKSKINSPRMKSITAQRISSVNSKRLMNTRLESGNALVTEIDKAHRSNSPKFSNTTKTPETPKQISTPRSSGVTSSSIPRNISKDSPLKKRFK